MKLKARHILVLGVILAAGTALVLFALGKHNPATKDHGTQLTAAQTGDGLPTRPPIESRSYNDVRAKIEAARVSLASRYRQTTSSSQQAGIIAEARLVITQSISVDIFPYWYGTAWDFNGTTETPGKGKIACGYFVSTVLRDAGLKVQRVKLAQQASENIILSLTTAPHIKRFRRTPINDFVDAVSKWGPGLYVVGLDIHTGFIVNIGGDVYFIHSSYVEPYAVVRENARESKILAASQYRVIGKVSADDQLIVNWLMGKEVLTRGV